MPRIVVALVAAIGLIVTSAPASNAVVVSICTIKANYPHGSTHVQGTINAEGTIACTSIVDNIWIDVYLEKSTGQEWSAPSKSYNNVSHLANYGNTSCANGPGTFRARVQYAITFPAGYAPRYHASYLYSPWRSVGCGLARTAESDSIELELQVKEYIDGSVGIEERVVSQSG